MFYVEPLSFVKYRVVGSYDACLRGENCTFCCTKMQEGGVFVVYRTPQGRLWIYSGAIGSIVAFNFELWGRHLPTDDER